MNFPFSFLRLKVVLQVPKGMTKVTPKKSSFVSFSSQNRTSLFATDDAPPTCLWFGWLFGANPTLQENKHYLGGETSPHELSHAWQRQHLNARRQEGCTRHQLGKRITNKQTGTAGEHYRDEGNHLSIDDDLLHLDGGQTTRLLWPAPGLDHSQMCRGLAQS